MRLPEPRGAVLGAGPASLCGWLLFLANLGQGRPGMGRSPSSVVGMAVTGQGLAPRAVPNLLLAWARGSKGPVWARVWLEKVQGLLTAGGEGLGGAVVTAATTKPLPQALGWAARPPLRSSCSDGQAPVAAVLILTFWQ